MGRYASFNTEFEYKFAFGEQPSDDITIFGGYETCDYDNETNTMEHTWTSDDKEFIYNEIKKYNIDFKKYEKNLNGTHQLRSDLYDIDINHTIRLGCLIYHQLLYTPVLICNYEVF